MTLTLSNTDLDIFIATVPEVGNGPIKSVSFIELILLELPILRVCEIPGRAS